MTATRKTTRLPEPRTAHLTTIGNVRVLWLSVGKLTTAYRLESLESDFGRAFRLSKADNGSGESEVYDVNFMISSRSCRRGARPSRWTARYQRVDRRAQIRPTAANLRCPFFSSLAILRGR
jgi:hypothetical protein